MRYILAFLLLANFSYSQEVVDLRTIVEINTLTVSLQKDSSIVVYQTDQEKAIHLICTTIVYKNFIDDKLRIRIGMNEFFIRKTPDAYYIFNNQKVTSLAKIRCLVKEYLQKKYD